jgi:hypothetical protein
MKDRSGLMAARSFYQPYPSRYEIIFAVIVLDLDQA